MFLKILFETLFGCCSKEKQSETIDVDLRIIRTDWLFQKQNKSKNGNDFLELISLLDDAKNQNLNTTNFVEAILETIYTLRKELFNVIWLPFMVQAISCFIYFTYYIQHEEFEFTILGLVLQLCIVFTTIYFVYLEYL